MLSLSFLPLSHLPLDAHFKMLDMSGHDLYLLATADLTSQSLKEGSQQSPDGVENRRFKERADTSEHLDQWDQPQAKLPMLQPNSLIEENLGGRGKYAGSDCGLL